MTALIFDPIYSDLALPAGHRFPIQKYRLLHDRLCRSGIVAEAILRPEPLQPDSAKGSLCADYIERFVTGTLTQAAIRKIGFPWSERLVRRTFTSVGGTLLAGLMSLRYGCAINLAGGYHHAGRNSGSGFCIVNDLYLSALALLQQRSINRVLIFDCDVHQGDGTATLAQQDSRIFTVSIHGEKNFPFLKQTSDRDVSLPKGVTDDRYLQCVKDTLLDVIACFRPDAVIYDAGADIYCHDELGHFDISLDGVYQRDCLVFEECSRAGLPVSAVIGGGYQRDLETLVDVHFQLFRAALTQLR